MEQFDISSAMIAVAVLSLGSSDCIRLEYGLDYKGASLVTRGAGIF